MITEWANIYSMSDKTYFGDILLNLAKSQKHDIWIRIFFNRSEIWLASQQHVLQVGLPVKIQSNDWKPSVNVMLNLSLPVAGWPHSQHILRHLVSRLSDYNTKVFALTRCPLCRHSYIHRENSPITQTIPEPTLLSRGGWPHPHTQTPHPHSHPHPTPHWPRCQTRSYRAYQATQTPLFSNTLVSPFDTQVCHKRQICFRIHRILKVVLEMAFSAHCTQIWKLNRISMTIISKVTRKCIWCCGWVQRCVTASHWARRWGNIVKWGMKAWSR